ncbi:MAG: DNA polymerase III subunit delta' [Calditrichaeota bacterium]|nr:DNA polymerase III subunit delta' [Calditrichota bacterium]
MEYFKELVLQNRIKDFFQKSIQNNRLAHAYLFYGGEGRGKEAFALNLAKTLNCQSDTHRPCGECANCQRISHFNHPDVRFLFPAPKNLKSDQIKKIIQTKVKNPYAALNIPGGKNISIDLIRELKEEAKFGSFEGGYRVVIISGAEYFSREAANSFLKLLEEPPEQFIIILISETLHAIIDTIRSRCQPVYFPEFTDEQIIQIVSQYDNVDRDIKPLIRMARHNLKRIFAILHKGYAEQKEWVYQFLRAVAVENYFHINELIESVRYKGGQAYYLELLNILSSWFQDTLHIGYESLDNQIINIDLNESVQRFAQSFPNVQVDKIIEVIEKAYKAIENNAHPILTLMNLGIEMRGLLGPLRELKEAT